MVPLQETVPNRPPETTRLHTLATFSMATAFSGLLFLYPLLAYDLGAEADEVAMILVGRSLVYVIVCLLAGRFARRFGSSRTAASIGIGIAVPTASLLPFCSTPWQTVPVVYLLFAGIAMFIPAMQSMMGEAKTRTGLLRRLLVFNLAWGSATAVCPAVTGPLSQRMGMTPAFVLLAILLAVALCATLLMRRPRPDPARNPGSEPPAEDEKRNPDDERFVIPAWAMVALALVILSIVRDIYPDVAIKELGVSKSAWGLLISSSFIFMIGGFLLMGQWRGWLNRLAPLVAIQLLAIPALVGFYVLPYLPARATLPILALCLWAVGFNLGVCYFASIYYSVSRRELKEKRTGVHEAMPALGALVGALIAWALIGATQNNRIPCLAVAMLVPLFILFEVWMVRRRQPASAF